MTTDEIYMRQDELSKRMKYSRETDGRLIFDVSSLTDSDIRLCMRRFEKGIEDGQHFYPEIIDFKELSEMECPVEGCHFEQQGNDLTIDISSFSYMGYRHYYADIKYYGLVMVEDGKCAGQSFLPPDIKMKFINALVDDYYSRITENVWRVIVMDDFADKHSDWDGYHIGDLTHRFYSPDNALEYAKRVVEVCFNNYGNIEIERHY